jgi:hypothetical protein
MTIRVVPCQGDCRILNATAGEGCRQGNREIKAGLVVDGTEEFPGVVAGSRVGLFFVLRFEVFLIS